MRQLRQGDIEVNPLYSSWITLNVPDPYGTCAKHTSAMCEAFPELKRVRGFYYCASWGERQHWWCVTPDGTIVDPTAAQFPSKGRGVYVEWDESAKQPTGMCMDCGSYCYDCDTFCSPECERSTMAYMMSGNY